MTSDSCLLVALNEPSSHPHKPSRPQRFICNTRLGNKARTVISTVPVGGTSVSDVAFPLTVVWPPVMPGCGVSAICMDTW